MSRTIFIKNRRMDGIVDAVFNYGVLVLALGLCWFVLY
jgi:hypothetical protein